MDTSTSPDFEEDALRAVTALPAPARHAWAQTHVRLEEGELLVVRFARNATAALLRRLAEREPEGFWALIREPGGLSLTLPATDWRVGSWPRSLEPPSAPQRVLSFLAPLPLDLCGYLAPLATRLAAARIPMLAQCGFEADHVLVPAERSAEALRLVERWIALCAGATGG